MKFAIIIFLFQHNVQLKLLVTSSISIESCKSKKAFLLDFTASMALASSICSSNCTTKYNTQYKKNVFQYGVIHVLSRAILNSTKW